MSVYQSHGVLIPSRLLYPHGQISLIKVLFVVLWVALPDKVLAHGFGQYVATPVSPPVEFVWWLPIALGLLWLGSYVIMRKVFQRNYLLSMFLSIASVAAFAVPFFLYGLSASRRTTGPPPGLGWPCGTFWGFGWREGGGLFVIWNLMGYGLFLGVLLLCGGMKKLFSHFKSVLLVSAVSYLFALAPFLCTGALLHGWCGGYVHNGCRERIEVINSALCDYADANQGRLPNVRDLNSLLSILKPFTATNVQQVRFQFPLEICPLGGAYERSPLAYHWNKKYAGLNLHEVDYDNNSEYLHMAPITCHYHNSSGHDWSWTLMRRIDQRRNAKAKSDDL